MPSTFTWLDYSEHEKRRMLDVINLFREQDTRDELGLGVIRDGFADALFPGTSTIQTRARYFLFIPWMYLTQEQRKAPSHRIADRARYEETFLIENLLYNGETDGVIGRQARKALLRLPTNIYWQGLGALGIRVFPGSQDQYHQSLDAFYRRGHGAHRADDGEPVDGLSSGNWHAGLPPVPEGFPNSATFALAFEEAEYLRERILTRQAGTLFAFLVDNGEITRGIEFPWEHPQFASFPTHIREQLEHARCFSEIFHGAALLYNLMLAEKAEHLEDLRDEYEGWLDEWAEGIDARREAYLRWNRNRFWSIVQEQGMRVGYPTRDFINNWLALVNGHDRAAGIRNDKRARRLIHERERALKHSKSRLDNQRSLELWSGAAGTAQLSYRWRGVEIIVNDILAGLQKGGNDA